MNNDKIKKIREVYAYISETEKGESIVAMNIPLNGVVTLFPFLCADKTLASTLKTLAEKIAEDSGQTIKFVKFDNRKTLETLEP